MLTFLKVNHKPQLFVNLLLASIYMDQSLQPSSTRAEVIVCLTHTDGPLTTSSLWMF